MADDGMKTGISTGSPGTTTIERNTGEKNKKQK
jgi:hypothetical protein